MHRKKRDPLSIKNMVFLLFLAVMALTIGGIGTMVYVRWSSSAVRATDDMASTVSRNIQEQINNFMRASWQAINTSHAMLSRQIVPLDNDILRDRFFSSALSTWDSSIYSISFGAADGRYYGARRNAEGKLEIIYCDSRTGGRVWYYTANDQMAATEKVLETGQYDPRTRIWYTAAVEKGQAVYSPVYSHYIMDDLVITAARPLFDENGTLLGVLGVHVLLNRINEHLIGSMAHTGGQAVLVERESGLLVANSLGLENFSNAVDGLVMRTHINGVPNKTFAEVYTTGKPKELREFRISTMPYQLPGIDWLVITALPRKLLFSDVQQTIVITILWSLMALGAGLIIYHRLTSRLMQPLTKLLEVSKALADGDLTQRMPLTRKDEIGGIAESMNNLADAMHNLINNLEQQVQERTEDLEASKGQLELLLNSTAEGIYGIDISGNCTFCNQSAVQLLGYASTDQLLGKPIHEVIHHSNKFGTPISRSSCKIFQAIHEGRGFGAEDEVFWRMDGSCFEVAYYAFPQIRNGKVVGGVVSFMDITERKTRENQIAYLGSHDSLTGLFNRRFLEEQLRRLDSEENLPLSLIFADLNGLKLVNDIFGHNEGDNLLCQAAEVLKTASRGGDVVARIGGDEFILLLPNTDQVQTRMTISLIHAHLASLRSQGSICSMALGYETRHSRQMSFTELMANAENSMYRDKLANRKVVEHSMLNTLQEMLYARSPQEEQHAKEVCILAQKLGSSLHLAEAELATLKRAAMLHDIGKVSMNPDLLGNEKLNEDEQTTMQQHTVVGYRLLNLFDDTLLIAEIVYSHHERWDGKGYPRGLAGTEIPLLSRIIAIAEVYARVQARTGSEHVASEEIRRNSGTWFDPMLTTRFLELVSG